MKIKKITKVLSFDLFDPIDRIDPKYNNAQETQQTVFLICLF
jgi:hypothetical protein